MKSEAAHVTIVRLTGDGDADAYIIQQGRYGDGDDCCGNGVGMKTTSRLRGRMHRRRSDWNSGGTHGRTYCKSPAVEAKNTFSYISYK